MPKFSKQKTINLIIIGVVIASGLISGMVAVDKGWVVTLNSIVAKNRLAETEMALALCHNQQH